MTDVLYKRAWRVTVDTLQLDSIDVAFKIKRTLAGRAGTCDLTIYNLTHDHRAEIQRFHLRGTGALGGPGGRIVRVEAGYESNMSVLYQGDVREVCTVREHTEWKTNVLAADGLHAYRGARVQRSFGPNAQIADVVAEVADSAGVGEGNVREALAAAQLDRVSSLYPQGTITHGAVAGELTRLLSGAGFTWSVQQGVLQVIPTGNSLARAAIELSADHGLIESPQVSRNRVVTCKSLLIPELFPGRTVSLNSDVVKGFYRIDEVEFSGDTRGQDWYANLTMRPLWRVLGFGRNTYPPGT